jgi:hypothetical protein
VIDAARLSAIEAIVDDSAIAGTLEDMLPVGARARQLSIRTLFIGILIALADHRPAHLTRIHQALCSLGEADQARLGVICEQKGQPHRLTYRQVEYTFGLVLNALGDKQPACGSPSQDLTEVLGELLGASIPALYKDASSSYGVDWTDVESFARPASRPRPGALEKGSCDPEASWGHRNSGGRSSKKELFFGYYLSLATMVRDESGPEVPELVVAMNLSSCAIDPVPAFLPALWALAGRGVKIREVLADSGYANRVPEHWAIPLRQMGARIVTDLHPSDRGRQGTFKGAVCFNGNLYCPQTPEALFELSPLARGASPKEIESFDAKAKELSRYKLTRVSTEDAEGYHRVQCPGITGKLRCPLRPCSMSLGFDRPEVLSPPEHPGVCCNQLTITVPPSVNAKTKQKHDYPSRAHRISYARRSAVERSNSRIKDAATTDIKRGWCRLLGLTAMSLMLGCALVVANLAVIESFEASRNEDYLRAALGKPPKSRKRRRKTLADLVTEG